MHVGLCVAHRLAVGLYAALRPWPMDAATEKAMKHLGKRIAALRKAKNWSTEKLAAEAGISFASVYAYENGKREPKITQVMNVARALGVTLDQLLDGVPHAA